MVRTEVSNLDVCCVFGLQRMCNYDCVCYVRGIHGVGCVHPRLLTSEEYTNKRLYSVQYLVKIMLVVKALSRQTIAVYLHLSRVW